MSPSTRNSTLTLAARYDWYWRFNDRCTFARRRPRSLMGMENVRVNINGRRRKLACVVTPTLVAAAMTTILAVPASASTPTPLSLLPTGPGVTVVEVFSGFGGGPRHAIATCTTGTLVGTGFARSGGGSGVVIDAVVPIGNQVTVTAVETAAGTPNQWGVTARAFCATGISNVQVKHDESLIDGVNPKTVEVECPFGTRVIGTAFQALGAQGEVIVTKMDPVAGVAPADDKAVVKAYADDNGIAGTWGVGAWAFCAAAPAGLEIVARTLTPPPNTSSYTVSAGCTGSKVVVGAGTYLSSVATGNVLLYGLSANHYTVGEEAQASAIEDANGTPAAWSLTTKVICANP